MNMRKRKEHAAPDERVQQETNSLGARNFTRGAAALLILLAVKAVCWLCGMPWVILLPEMLALLAGGAAAVVLRTARGLWGPKDERMQRENAACLSIAWTILHCTAVLTCAVMLFADREHYAMYMLSMLIMVLNQYIFMGQMTKKGLLLSGSKGFNWLRYAGITAATLVMGLVMLFLTSRLTGRELPPWAWVTVEALLLLACILGGALASAATRRSERNADEQLMAAEEADEE